MSEPFEFKPVLNNKQIALRNLDDIVKFMRGKTDQSEAVQFWLNNYAEMVENEVNKIRDYERNQYTQSRGSLAGYEE